MTGVPKKTTLSAVREALLRDPISIAYRHGGVLLYHMVLVGQVGRRASPLDDGLRPDYAPMRTRGPSPNRRQVHVTH